ncbi:hypothetical protein HDR59_02180 [bacterium]|nr:hypothetical protein [bacterium]
MKSKILMCLILASCSTMFAKGNKAKDVYTDIVKSTEIKDDILIKKDDVYVCDYRYDKDAEEKKYFKFCDKDGKPLKDVVEFGNNKYSLIDGVISVITKNDSNGKLKELSMAQDADVSGYIVREFMNYEDEKKLTGKYYSEDLRSQIHKDYCPDGKISQEAIVGSYDIYVNIYNEVKKDGVKLNTPLIKETVKSSKIIDNQGGHFINGEKVLDGHFEISMCGNPTMSYTIKNGKYDGDYVVNNSHHSEIRKYENGKLLSLVENLKNEVHMSGDDCDFTYNKYEKIKDGDEYLHKYYLDDKLVYEGDWGF